MKNSRKWGAAAIVAGVLAAQSVMASEPSRDYEPVAKSFDQSGSARGFVQTETAREYEPVALTVGGGSARRGQVLVERLSGFRTLALSLGGIRRVWLGW